VRRYILPQALDLAAPAASVILAARVPTARGSHNR
jgi:hypothetical protein